MPTSAQLKLDKQNLRRETIVHAAWRVAAIGGLSALTIRAIAQELSLTTGVVMHHFLTKEAILQEMFDRLYSGLVDDVQKAIASSPPEKRLETMLLACLPLTEASSFGWRLAVVLQAEVLRLHAIGLMHRQNHEAMERGLHEELVLAQREGILRSDLDLQAVCTRLVMLIEGIGTHAVLRPERMGPEQQRELIRSEIEALKVKRLD
jgi:AcrR family transcriptional regulator